MKSPVALALALASIGPSAQPTGRPCIEVRHVICGRCGGTERTGCTCEIVNVAARNKAQNKRDRKNHARLVQFNRQRAGQLRASV